jgi:excisionase family DNA binding protein
MVKAGNVRDYFQMSEHEVCEPARHAGIRAVARLLRHAELHEANSMNTNNDFNPAEYESTGAAAMRTKRSQSWIYTQMRAGRIRGVKIGHRWCVRSEDVDALLKNAPRCGEPNAKASA